MLYIAGPAVIHLRANTRDIQDRYISSLCLGEYRVYSDSDSDSLGVDSNSVWKKVCRYYDR